MIHRFAIALSLVLGLSLGCGVDPTETPLEPEAERLASERARIAAPEVSDGARATLISDNAAFALDLYRALEAEDEENIFFSPHSISLALAMTYAGAEGETEREMADALHFTLPDEELHAAFNELDASLAARRTRLDIINAAWAQRGYAFLPEYLDLLAEHYGAGVYLLDFAADPMTSRDTVNEWVAERTEDRIPELLGEGDVTSLTRLILTNAIFFNAAWKYEFDEAETHEQDFFCADGRVAAAEMMYQRADLRTARGSGWQAVELPYADDEMAMIAILPEGDLTELESALTAATLDEVVSGLEEETIDLSFPSFTFGYDLPLAEELRDLGMETAFGPGANFSGMDGSRELFIGAALHQAFVEVTERGTEAGAATAVVMDWRSEGSRPVVFDRPFMFLIRDLETGAVLFLGRVVDPTAGE